MTVNLIEKRVKLKIERNNDTNKNIFCIWKGGNEMVDLTKKPYYLNEEQIKWVEETIASMTVEEKIGQLFVNMVGKCTKNGNRKILKN